MLHADPVCAEPKLFVGGLRFEATRDDVVARFQAYGPIKSCVLLTHKDSGKSKGCAMVLFHKWAHAEAAVQQDNGAISDLSGAARPLIVKFADPQRRPDDGMLIGVTPKKLFIGQIPSGITQEQIRSICAPYGDIVDCNVMAPKRDNAMGCAFVTYATWAAAEAAAEALNGTFTFPGAAAPIAVKLADAKPSDMQKIGAKRGMMDMMGGGAGGGGGMGAGGAKRQMMGGGMRGMMGGYGGMGMGMSPMMMGMGMPGMMGQGMMGQGMMGQGMMNPGMMGMMGPMGMMGQGQAGGNMGQPGAMGQGQSGAIGPAGPPGMEGQPGAAAMGQEAAGQPGQVGGMSGAMGGYGQQGMNMNMPMGYGGMGGMGMGGMGMGGMGMGGMGMNMPHMGGMGMGGMGMGGMGGGMKSGAQQGLGIGNQNGNLQAAKAWKLFIGQISFDLAEPDLFAFFSQFGTILELVLLRNPGDGGRHRGCGFLVYNSAQEAESALQADQAMMPNDPRQRKISVRYANQKGV